MCIELKIKSKHLALEPAIIKREEAKLKRRIKYHRSDDQTSAITLGWKLDSLVRHRKMDVRNESRATHLARTYLAGKPYARAELKRNDDDFFKLYIVPRVVAMVQKYGSRDQRSVDKKAIIDWAKLPE